MADSRDGSPDAGDHWGQKASFHGSLARPNEHDNDIMASSSVDSKLVNTPNFPEHLGWPSTPSLSTNCFTIVIKTKSRASEGVDQRSRRRDKIAEAMKTILDCLGEDITREGLLKTPQRYAEAMLFLTHGYELSVKGSFQTMYWVIC